MKISHLPIPALAAFALVGVAAADTVAVQCTSTGAGQGVSVVLNGNNHNPFAGQINLSLTNSVGQNLNGSWIAFCSELDQYISVGGGAQTYDQVFVDQLPDPGPAMGIARADAIARMYYAANGAQYGNDNDYAAAFQVAIWEIVYDFAGAVTVADLSNGIFTGAGFSNNMLTDLGFLFLAASGNGPQASLQGLSNHDNQDQVIELPTPGAFALLGVASMLGGRRRRG